LVLDLQGLEVTASSSKVYPSPFVVFTFKLLGKLFGKVFQSRWTSVIALNMPVRLANIGTCSEVTPIAAGARAGAHRLA
jgi:hypothetical protein